MANLTFTSEAPKREVRSDVEDTVQASPLEDSITDDYVEPSMLDIPEFDDNDQYVYRWLRITIRGEDDYNNISRRQREGWTFVKAEDLPDGFRFGTLNSTKNPEFDGCVRNGDLVLGKLPRKKAEGYMRRVFQNAQNAQQAISNRRLVDKDTGAVAQNEGQTFVTRGRASFEQ